MMKQVIAALLATVAWMPAQAQEDEGRPTRAQRMERVKDDAARPDRAPRYVQPAGDPAPRPRAEQPRFGGDAGRQADRDGGRRDWGNRDWGNRDQRPSPVAEAPSPGRQWGRRGDTGTPERQAAESRPDWRREAARRDEPRNDDARRFGDRSGADAVRRYEGRRDDIGRSNAGRPGDRRWGADRWQAGTVYRGDDRRFGNGRDWSRDWRNDRRYDWGRYRQSNRGLYRLPRYYAPSDWDYGYRRFSIGVTLSAGLWDQSYWIDDPYEYRLPPADGPYRWVRYYNDALLIDIETGEVVDTVYDIFY